ncbi:MAG: glycosyltransferase [Desulfomonile tiedjei]|uniref:Glycosyltransferase n=1 Tax=Desulfomonile tiedjei TaxID=2358 RepID=A0A9D6UZK0_9BACT|nr:glycosyltransferase [Desulfomonile tiedjei]
MIIGDYSRHSKPRRGFREDDSATPLVSVVLPVFNEKAACLEKAVASILAQTFDAFELLVLDDGSDREETIHLLDSLPDRDKRIRLFRGPNTGVAAVLNKGLNLARGDLICRQDSDDWSEPDRIRIQFEFLRARPELAMVGSNIALHQEDAEFLWTTNMPQTPEEVKSTLPLGNPFCHGSVCFRRARAQEIGGYRLDLNGAEDYDLFWRMCEEWGGANLAQALYHLRRAGSSVSGAQATNVLVKFHMVQVLAKMRHNGEAEDLDLARALVNKDHARLKYLGQLKQADHLLLAGHYSKALRGYSSTFKNPCFSWLSVAKLLRSCLFIMVPAIRKHLFIILLIVLGNLAAYHYAYV